MAICIIGSKVPVTIPLSFDLGEMERAKDHIPAFLPPGGEGAPGHCWSSQQYTPHDTRVRSVLTRTFGIMLQLYI